MSGEALPAEAATTEPGAPLALAPLDGEAGLRVVDRVERREYALRTPAPVVPDERPPERFPMAVDAAASVTTEAVTLRSREGVYVWDASGDYVTHTVDEPRSVPAAEYLIEVTTPVKLYLQVAAPLEIQPAPDATTIAFGSPTAVVVGARSLHSRPAGTVTATDDLDDLRRAVEAMGSALKTTGPERSYPTLRGHPPRIEFGEALVVSDALAPPPTGIALEVRESLADLLVAAPLAYYLGAELRWGERQLVTETGFERPLAHGGELEAGVERLLEQAFVMDCLTRSEGRYPVDLRERRVFEGRTGGAVDLAELYHLPPAQRLEAYLDVDYETVADLVPTWSATTFVEPVPSSVRALPYLLDTLSTVRTAGPRRLEPGGGPNADPAIGGPGARRGAAAARQAGAGPHVVLPARTDAATTAWVGEGVPIGATKVLPEGFDHRLEREPAHGSIRLEVVCNDPEMAAELEAVEAIYGERGEPAFDVDVRTAVTTDALRRRLEADADFFHFIGHVDRRGFECPDGWFDAAACDRVGTDVFLLNGCRSHGQGEELVRRGAIAGIVTVTDLLNHHAVEIGRTLARFLNGGFPLYAALDVARDVHRFGDAYAVLGDAHAVVAQPATTGPEYLDLRYHREGRVSVAHRTFPCHWVGLGAELRPPYDDGEEHRLFGGEVDVVELDVDELAAILAEPTPLRVGDDLRCSLPARIDGA